MNVKEIFGKEIVETPSKMASCFAQQVLTNSYFYNVEFGKTYYFRYNKGNNQMCVMGVKFHGITINSCILLIGECANGKTITVGSSAHDARTYYLTSRGQIDTAPFSIYLYTDKECKNALSETDKVSANVQQLINYLYPNKVRFYERRMFRYCWDGTKVILKDFYSHFARPMYIFFTKPKNSLWIAKEFNQQICFSLTEPSKIEVGKVMLIKDNAEEKLNNFFNTTYYDVETCKLHNKIEICDFDEEQEEEQEELVYIEFIGLVKKETAKEILKQLKGIEI